MKATIGVVSILFLVTSCSDERADAGLIGSDRVSAIVASGPASVEPFFFSEIRIDQSDQASLSMKNSNGDLATRTVNSPRGSFAKIARELADFRLVTGHARSMCAGISDAGSVTVHWHYASGKVSSYSVQPGCQQHDEKRFLEAAASIGRRVGLQSWIDRAPKPL